MKPLSVHQVIDHLPDYEGKTIVIYGALSLDFEGTCLWHIPKSERKKETQSYSSSIWVDFDPSFLDDQLKRYDGRQVTVKGLLKAPDPKFGGCGHFSLWPAELLVQSIEKHEETEPCVPANPL